MAKRKTTKKPVKMPRDRIEVYPMHNWVGDALRGAGVGRKIQWNHRFIINGQVAGHNYSSSTDGKRGAASINRIIRAGEPLPVFVVKE